MTSAAFVATKTPSVAIVRVNCDVLRIGFMTSRWVAAPSAPDTRTPTSIAIGQGVPPVSARS